MPPADGPAQARKDILFWTRIAADWQVKFAVDGITTKPLLDWLRQQKCADYVEGDYFGKPQLPLLHD
ncbi:hypothetical protein [Loigolactobacillus zhaoyuanensis]|uniref:EAL domain-containing protein n=1 Tax=Loigolactobacillus zhaoyuanensis TaxID=2486017 RepID=A0ABW8UDW1_9LACO|nr:hypothetical protein [Loigolactobacillus zhaoyuanensis]